MAFSFYRRPVLERRTIMFFSSWLRNLRSNRGSKIRASRRPAPRFRPRLEALDDRIVPSQVNLTVSSLADSGTGTLRAAILAADAGSHSDKFTIGFTVTGTIDLQSPLPDLNNTIDILGPGASSLTVERAARVSFSSAIITVDANQAASISGLTIANGNAGGIISGGTLTVTNCGVVNNSAAGPAALGSFGGGIDNNGGGSLTVSGCTISGNSANFGGGISNTFGSLTVTASTVSGNSATGVQFTGVPDEGGGISNFGVGGMTVSGCTISGNSAQLGGGIGSDTNATITNSTTLSGNSAVFGGGIANYFGTLTVSSSNISLNPATYGGGIYNHYGTLTVRDCVFTGNSATDGAAVYNDAGSTLIVRGSTFSANTASDSGGAISNLGTAMLQECTLSGNTAGSDGGGIFNAASGTLAVKDSTVLHNVALLGADLFNDHGSVTVDDSVIGDWFNA
jgi:hypothetical protein